MVGAYAPEVEQRLELLACNVGFSRCGPLKVRQRPKIVADFAAGDGSTWDLTLKVDGVDVATAADLPQLLAIAPFQGFDVGIDRMSPVSWTLYERHGSFPFTGTLRSATWTPGAGRISRW